MGNMSKFLGIISLDVIWKQPMYDALFSHACIVLNLNRTIFKEGHSQYGLQVYNQMHQLFSPLLKPVLPEHIK